MLPIACSRGEWLGTAAFGEMRVDDQLARTIRTRYFSIPHGLVNRAGRPTLRLQPRPSQNAGPRRGVPWASHHEKVPP